MRPLEVLTRFDELLGVVCDDPSCLVEWSGGKNLHKNKMLFLVRVCLSLDLSASNTSLCLVR